jgi:hypothetical protein
LTKTLHTAVHISQSYGTRCKRDEEQVLLLSVVNLPRIDHHDSVDLSKIK